MASKAEVALVRRHRAFLADPRLRAFGSVFCGVALVPDHLRGLLLFRIAARRRRRSGRGGSTPRRRVRGTSHRRRSVGRVGFPCPSPPTPPLGPRNGAPRVPPQEGGKTRQTSWTREVRPYPFVRKDRRSHPLPTERGDDEHRRRKVVGVVHPVRNNVVRGPTEGDMKRPRLCGPCGRDYSVPGVSAVRLQG